MKGGDVMVDRAYGLMQVIPSTVAWYNQLHPKDFAYFEDVSGKTERAARMQIRIGCWLLAHNVRMLHKFDPQAFPGTSPGTASPEQLGQALIAYAIGLGALRKRLRVLKEKELPLTQGSLHEQFPLWDYSKTKEKWINRPLHYGSVVWRNYERNKTNIPGTVPPPNPTGQPTTVVAGVKKDSPFGIPLLLVLAALIRSKLFKK